MQALAERIKPIVISSEFKEYIQKQESIIKSFEFSERVREHLGLDREATLKEKELYFIEYSMKEFEETHRKYLPLSGGHITFGDYCAAQAEIIEGAENSYYTGITVGQKPSKNQSAFQWINEAAAYRFRLRFGHLVCR